MDCKRLSEALQSQAAPGGARHAPANGILLAWLTPVRENGERTKPQ